MACYKCHTEAAGYVENTHAKRRFCSAKCQSRYYEIGGAADGKVLPPIPYPKHVLVIPMQYRDKKIHSYGTSFIRDLMLQEGMATKEFDELVQKCVNLRRAMLREFIARAEGDNKFKRGESLPSRYLTYPEKRNKVHEFLISPWLSPQLYTDLIPHVMKTVVASDQTKALIEFIKHVIGIDEYLVNWRDFGYAIGMIESPEYNDFKQVVEPLEVFKSSVCDAIQRKYRQQIEKEFNIEIYAPRLEFAIGDACYRRIPKGTLVYRGFKAYRGPLDKTLDFAFFAMDLLSTLAYLPPEVNPTPLELELDPLNIPLDYINDRSKQLFTEMMDVYCASLGGIAVFSLNTDLKVLDFGLIDTIRWLHLLLDKMGASEQIKDAATVSWKLSWDSPHGFDRQSVDINDRLVVDWMCRKGIDGYIAAGVKNLHNELMLCKVHTAVDYLGFYEPSKDLNFPICNDPYTRFNCNMGNYFRQ
jgi:hypothetical protein